MNILHSDPWDPQMADGHNKGILKENELCTCNKSSGTTLLMFVEAAGKLPCQG